MHVDSALAGQGGDFSRRVLNARGAGDVRDGDDPGMRCDGAFEIGQQFFRAGRRNRHGQGAHDEAVTLRAHAPRVVV